MTRLKSVISFLGGTVGVVVIAFYGLFKAIENVFDIEEKAAARTMTLANSLGIMNDEVKALSAEKVDIDFSKTLTKIDEVKKKLDGLSIADKVKQYFGEGVGTTLDQELEVLEQRATALTNKKLSDTKEFDATKLKPEDRASELKATEEAMDYHAYRIEMLKASDGERSQIAALISENQVYIATLQAKHSAIKKVIDAESKTGKTDPKIAEANAKAEEKEIASGFKLKLETAKNAYDVAMAYAEKDAAKKIQIEKAYNQQVLQLTLDKLNAEIAAKTKTSELSGKKTKDPELQAELADLENQKLAAIDSAKAKGITLDIDAQNHAADIHKAELSAQSKLALGRIDLNAEKAITESKQAVDEVKRLKDQGAFGGGKDFDADLKTASQKHGFNYDAVQAQFASSAAAHGVPEQVLKAQAFQESGFNPRAKSASGAVGFSQFLQGTANHYGLSDRTDPIASIEAQARMMGEKIRQYGGRIDLALAAYNGGDKGADYLTRHPEYLQNPDTNAPANLWKNQTANYQKIILASAGMGGDGSTMSAGGQGADEKQLIAQAIESEQRYTEARIDAQNTGIEASIAAIKEKMALAEKTYTAEKSTATPEELPKIEADYALNKEKYTQELTQLQAELLVIKKQGDADLLAETNKLKQDEIALEESAAADLVQIAETEAQQQLELGNLSNADFLEKQREFEAQRYQIALKASQDRAALLNEGDASGKAKALAEETKLTKKHAADMKAINHKMALDSQQQFNSIVAPIKSAFSSNIQGILQGTLTLKQGMRNIFQSIMLSYAQSLAGMAIDAAAFWAWKKLGFVTTEVTEVAGHVAIETEKTAATVAGEESRVAVTTGAAAQTYVIKTASSLSSIAKDAAVAAAGAFSATAAIPYVGPVLAPAAAATAYAQVMMLAPLASAKGGDWEVGEDESRYLLHKKEMVLHATVATPMRDFFSGGYQKLMNPEMSIAPIREFLASQGNVSYSLPASIMQPQGNQSTAMATAASAIAMQQSFIAAQQKQQQRPSSRPIAINGKGGDWVHINEVAKILKKDGRNLKFSN